MASIITAPHRKTRLYSDIEPVFDCFLIQSYGPRPYRWDVRELAEEIKHQYFTQTI